MQERSDVERNSSGDESLPPSTQWWVHQVRSMDLKLPTGENLEAEESLFEDEETLDFIATHLKNIETEIMVHSVIQIPELESEPEVDTPESKLKKELIEGLMRDFTGSVLRSDVPVENLIPRGEGLLGWGVIELKPDARARKSYPIHLVGEKREAMVELVREWEAQGKVEEGQGEWSSPAFVVPKKNGKWRGVVDFRALNEATVGDSHPLPRIEDILVRQGGRSMYTIMDLKDAFHQVPLHPLSRPLTCTSTPIGTKQWCVVVMGLKNGVPIFQRVVEWCLRGVDDIASAYVDDILSGTEAQATKLDTLIAHEKDIRKVLEEMKATKLVADIKNATFLSKKSSSVAIFWDTDGVGRPQVNYWRLQNGKNLGP